MSSNGIESLLIHLSLFINDSIQPLPCEPRVPQHLILEYFTKNFFPNATNPIKALHSSGEPLTWDLSPLIPSSRAEGASWENEKILDEEESTQRKS